MFCSECGKEVPEDARICPNCGTKVKKEFSLGEMKYYAGQAASNVQDKAKQVTANAKTRYQEFKEEQGKAAETEERRREASFASQNQAQTAQYSGQGNIPNNMYMNTPPHMYGNSYFQIPAEYRPLSPWAYLGYNLLFMIPIAGFILILVFALGAVPNKNLQNFARFYVLAWILGIVFAFLLFAVAGRTLSSLFGSLILSFRVF